MSERVFHKVRGQLPGSRGLYQYYHCTYLFPIGTIFLVGGVFSSQSCNLSFVFCWLRAILKKLSLLMECYLKEYLVLCKASL